MSSLPLRRRMTIAVAIAVAVAVALAAMVAYLAVREALRGEVDQALEQQRVIPPPQGPPEGRFGRRFGPLPARFGGPTPYIQLIDAGDVRRRRAAASRSRSRSRTRARDVAAGVAEPFFADVDVNGTHTRVLTAPVGGGLRGAVRALVGARRLRAGSAAADPPVRGLRRGRLGGGAGPARLAQRRRPDRARDRRGAPHRRHRGPRSPDRGRDPRRGRRARRALQRDARHPGAIGRGAATTGRRRLARAPHPDHVAAHQHRGPRRVRGPAPGRARPAAGRRRGADGRAGHAGRGPDRARPRRRAVPGARGHPPGRPRPRGRHPRQAPRPVHRLPRRNWSRRSSTAPANASRVR